MSEDIKAVPVKEPPFIPTIFYVIVVHHADGTTKYVKEIWTRSRQHENGEVEIGRPYEVTKTDDIHDAKVYERADDALVVVYALTKAFLPHDRILDFIIYKYEETLEALDTIPWSRR